MASPEILYHYTDLEGLRGILEQRTLRATLIEDLADLDELIYGRNKISDAFRSRASEQPFARHRLSDGLSDRRESLNRRLLKSHANDRLRDIFRVSGQRFAKVWVFYTNPCRCPTFRRRCMGCSTSRRSGSRRIKWDIRKRSAILC